MNFLIAPAIVLILAAMPVAALAQESASTVSTRTGLGWTSNAEGVAGGRSDMFLTYGQSAGFSHIGPDFALRGGIDFQTTRYRRLTEENDWSSELSLEAEMALSPTSRLRGEAALGYGEEGALIATAPTAIGATTPELKGRLGFEFIEQFGATTITLGAGYAQHRTGATRFDTNLAAPARTRAGIGIYTGRAHAAHALTPAIAINGLGEITHSVIARADRFTFGRLDATVVRLAAGLSAHFGDRAGLDLGGGVDMVFAGEGALPMRTLPYGEAEIVLGLLEGLTLRAGFGTHTEMVDPADGYLDWILNSRAGVTYAPAPGLELEAALFAGTTTSVGFDMGIESNRGGEIGVSAALSPTASLSGTLSHKRVSGLAPSYSENRAALMISMAI